MALKFELQLPRRGNNPKRPVIVHIHPGGFYIFGGTSSFVGPEYLLDQDVVLVSFNYRLASLGEFTIVKITVFAILKAYIGYSFEFIENKLCCVNIVLEVLK